MDPQRQPRSAARARPRFTVREEGDGRLALHLVPCPVGVVTDGLEDLGITEVRLADGRRLPAVLVGALDGDLEFTAALAGGVEVSVQSGGGVVRAEGGVLEAVLRRWIGAHLYSRGVPVGLDGVRDRSLAGLILPLPGSGWHEPRVACTGSPSGSWTVEFRAVTDHGVPVGTARRWIGAHDTGWRTDWIW